jgi:hypothetical protein
VASFMERAIGAARLDAATYEEVEHDTDATGQAVLVIVAASLAAGIGAARGGVLPIVLGIIGSLIAWLLWAGITLLVGTRLLPTERTEADLGQLFRTLGFAAGPGVLAVFALLPVFGGLVALAGYLWQLAAMVVAVRQALDYESTGRAVAVCLIGFVIYVLVLAFFVGSLLHFAGAPAAS